MPPHPHPADAYGPEVGWGSVWNYVDFVFYRGVLSGLNKIFISACTLNDKII